MSTDWKDYLASQGAEFTNSSLTGFSQRPEATTDCRISVLASKSFIAISGPDSSKFLQGQISIHMDRLKPSEHRPGVGCTPKGRMYSSFRLLKTNDGYLLALDNSIAEHTISTLSKYAVFFKSDLKPAEQMVALGLSGSQCTEVMKQLGIDLPDDNLAVSVDGGYLIRIADSPERFELWIDQKAFPHWWEKLSPACTPSTDKHWLLLDIKAVHPSVTSDILEKYIPQHLNMATLGAVSFRKGCYTGQEIITRMQSLGQEKSRTYRTQFDSIKTLNTGDKLYDAQGKSVGEIIISTTVKTTETTEALAVVRVDIAETGKAFLDSEQTQEIRILPLPYTVDRKAELQQ